MRRKPPVPFTHKFPHVDPLALRLLHRLLAFDPKDRPTAEEVELIKILFCSSMYQTLEHECGFLCEYIQALADPYFYGLANVDREPSTQPIPKLEFEFERRKLTRDDVRELMYREVNKDIQGVSVGHISREPKTEPEPN